MNAPRSGGSARSDMATSRRGIALAAAAAMISGISVWVNSYGVSQVPDAILYTTLKNAVAVAILAALLMALRAGRPAPATDRPAQRMSARTATALVLVGIFGGGLAFILFFSGLAQATASGAAFIQKTLFIWVALLAVPLLGERLGWLQIGALGALLAGQALLTPPRAIGWGTGETMIAAATLIWAAEVIVARRLLRSGAVTAAVFGVARLGIGLVVLIGVVVGGGHLGAAGAIAPAGWALVGLTGILLAAYVATWFAALQRAPATIVTSVLVAAAIITAILQSLAAGRLPDVAPLGGAVLVVAAIAVVVSRSTRATGPRGTERVTVVAE